MAKVKVFGGWCHIQGKQRRAILATTSKAKVAAHFGLPMSHVIDYWSETANVSEVATALEKPGTAFYFDAETETTHEYERKKRL